MVKKATLSKIEKDKIKSVINKIESNMFEARERYNNNRLTRKQYDRLNSDGKNRVKELRKLLRDNIPY